MKIKVTYIPQEHQACMFWFNNHKLTGIAEWENTLDCDHDDVEYDITSTPDGLIFEDMECNDCHQLTDEDKERLARNFDYDKYYAKGDFSYGD